MAHAHSGACLLRLDPGGLSIFPHPLHSFFSGFPLDNASAVLSAGHKGGGAPSFAKLPQLTTLEKHHGLSTPSCTVLNIKCGYCTCKYFISMSFAVVYFLFDNFLSSCWLHTMLCPSNCPYRGVIKLNKLKIELKQNRRLVWIASGKSNLFPVTGRLYKSPRIMQKISLESQEVH